MTESTPGFATLRELCATALGMKPVPAAAASDSGFAAQALALAERHRVAPLVAAGLTAAGPASDLPAHVSEAFRRRILAGAQQAVRMEQELGLIIRRLSAAGVDGLILKGAALACQAYPVPEWRGYDDLDLWVPSRDLDAAVRTLVAAGFQLRQPLTPRSAACARRAGIEVALVRPDRSCFVEIANGAPALAGSQRAAQEILAAAVELEVAGARIRAPAPVHALLLACRHGAHHAWDRLVWVADIAGLWRRFSPADRAAACATARRWRMETMLGLGLRLAADHLGLELDGRAAELAAAPRARALARRVGLEAMGPAAPRTSMIDRLRFENDAQDTAAQRLRTLAGWVFTPTLGDIAAWPLPAVLYPLYALVRPLRLLRHPWRRQWRALAGLPPA